MLFELSAYCHYLLRAQGPHLLHSPFVFQLYTNVIRSSAPAPKAPEEFRRSFFASEKRINLPPIGAGSKRIASRETSLKSIVRTASIPPKYGKLLYRLVQHFQPGQILELGTSSGISTLYMALAVPNAHVHTIEGNPAMADVAEELFRKADSSNITLHRGLFDTCLPKLLSENPGPDLVYLDGDHRKEAVMKNLSLLLPHMKPNGVWVIDDIHWSRDMQNAWQEIKCLPQVSVTIDLFRLGLVFFKKDQAKQHFVLRF